MKLKIPPPIWALLAAICIWFFPQYLPGYQLEFLGQTWVAVVFVVAGFVVDMLAMVQFRKAQTTVNPLSPDKSSQLVTTGIYGVSRNPMYLGMALQLLGIAIWVGSPIGVFFIALFVWIITELQIKPEEEILARIFGDNFTQWTKRVRRWI